MKSVIKVFAFLSVLSALTMGTGCNTVHGFGQDMTAAGNGVQRSADENH